MEKDLAGIWLTLAWSWVQLLEPVAGCTRMCRIHSKAAHPLPSPVAPPRCPCSGNDELGKLTRVAFRGIVVPGWAVTAPHSSDWTLKP